MKKLLIINIFIINLLFCFSQSYQDIVYLKNDTIIKGFIMEQIPDGHIKLKTFDGKLIDVKINDIDKIEKILVEIPEYNFTIDSKKNKLGYTKFNYNGLKLRYGDVKFITYNNKEAYKYAERAKWNCNVSYFFGGISVFFYSFLIYDFIDMSINYPEREYFGEYFGLIDAVIITTPLVASLILLKRANNKANSAVSIYNTDLKSFSHFKPSLDLKIGLTNNGIGLVMNF